MSGTLDTHYWEGIIQEINDLGSEACAQLQAIANAAFAQLKDLETWVNDEINKLGPIKELLSIPSDLGSVITWIENYVNSVLTPLYAPYAKYVEMLTQIATITGQLVSAVQNALSRIVGCAYSFPNTLIGTLEA